MSAPARRLTFAAFAVLFLIPCLLRAQHDHAAMVMSRVNVGDSSVERAALEATHAATARFADRRAAIAAGYRRVGMDFPSMGEHWINPSMLVTGSFDPHTPAVLTYATINGKPRLLGVVYAATLAPGESAPSFPGGSAVWHEHNGSIDEESLLPEHGEQRHSHTAVTDSRATRLAILHAWTALPNPAGMFVAENWALPFARNGLTVPKEFSLSAARELALISGGEEYYRRFFSIGPAGTPSPAEAELQRAMTDGRKILGARVKSSELSIEELIALARVWDRFASAVSSR